MALGFGLLPPLVVLALIPFMSRRAGLRSALLQATLAASIVLAVMTELLSLVHGLRPWVLTVAWLLILVAAVRLGLTERADGRPLTLTVIWARQRLRRGITSLRTTPTALLMTAVVVAILVAVLVVATASPPNNWDSMTYHLPRVMHWATNHTVDDYPTSIDRQLYLGPFAEYLLLHVYLLTGSDTAFNSVQWAALAGCAVAVSVIARQLGGDRRAQALAAVIAVTTPMALLQGSDTQNDLVEAFYFLLLVHAVLGWHERRQERPIDAWEIGGALALALFAKNTGALICAPFLLLWLVRARLRPGRLLAAIGVMAALVVAVNVGLAVRNELHFHSPLGDQTTSAAVSNAHITPAVTVTSMLRLFGSAATSPSTALDKRVLSVVTDGTKDVGISPADPDLLYGTTAYSMAWSVQEDTASFPVQVFAVLLICLAALLRLRPLRGLRAGYVLTCFGSFVIFAAYLRWQPWVNRLDLPLILGWSPVIAVAIAAWHRLLVLPALLCFAWMSPGVLRQNADRHLGGPRSVLTLPQNDIRFTSHPDLEAGYEQAVKIILASHAKTVGIITDVDDWEYPFWTMTGGALHGPHFVDIKLADLHGKPMPKYDVGICTDTDGHSCLQLARPGWTVKSVPNVSVATRTP